MSYVTTSVIELTLVWVLYFFLHSALASLGVKQWVQTHVPGIFPAYRLLYNAIALGALIPVVVLIGTGSPPLWVWTPPWHYLANGLAGLAIAGFVYTLRDYDGLGFIGLKQWRERRTSVMDDDGLVISPLHRLVRHPWYSLALVVIWTRDMSPEWLTSAILITGYFILGSRLEEHKLLLQYGSAYRSYQRRVPALLPLPWKYLHQEDMAAIRHHSVHNNGQP